LVHALKATNLGDFYQADGKAGFSGKAGFCTGADLKGEGKMLNECRCPVTPERQKMRPQVFRSLFIGLPWLLLSDAGAQTVASAPPARLSIEQLADASDLIVLVRVESIRGLHLLGNRRAVAVVEQVWRGSAPARIEFTIEPTDLRDVPDTATGEVALLFLEKAGGRLSIANSGRGRMPLYTRKEKRYVILSDVTVPADTPYIAVYPAGSEFRSAVTLETVHALVEKSRKRPAQPAKSASGSGREQTK
jgi:hypothetical protein